MGHTYVDTPSVDSTRLLNHWLRCNRLRKSRTRRTVNAAHVVGLRRFAVIAAVLALTSVFTAIVPSVPASAATISTTAIAPGGQTNCAIRSGGALYCWGNNAYGEFGNGTTTNSATPVLVPGGYTWIWVSTQFDYGDLQATTCGITNTNAGYCWGSNPFGEIGDGTTTQRLVPTLIAGSHLWSSIAVGYQDVCGITTAGAAYCWGPNGQSEVGDGTNTERTSPALVSGSHTWLSISEGYDSTCGIDNTNTAYCWGANNDNQLGDGTTTNRSTPTALSGTWSQINAGDGTTCGVKTSGSGYCWGLNSSGQVGDNTTTQRTTPTAVSGGITWSSIATGFFNSCGLSTAGTAYCWGDNGAGDVGDGTTTQRNVPTAVSGSYTFSTLHIGDDATSDDTNCGLTTGNVEYCWGYNSSDEVGDRTTTNRKIPTAVNWADVNTDSTISAGGQTTCDVRAGGVAYCWGNNTYGQLGNGSTINSSEPTQVLGGYTWQSISTEDDTFTGANVATTCGITTSGTGYCWGANTYGDVGDGTTTERLVPTAISGGYTWATISVGFTDVCGVTTSGAGYCWGYNGAGEVGDGTTTQRTSPTAVSGSYTWASIYDSRATTCGVTTSGAGYCWGSNTYGQIGDTTTTNRYSPTAVSGSYTWSTIVTGTNISCGVTTSGAGYCWGSNNYGQVGDGTTTDRHSPTSISGSYTWASISGDGYASCGVTTAGVGYCWGYNGAGEVGDGTTTQRTSPTAVSGNYIFSAISTGADYTDDTDCGLTTSGLDYCWGYNNNSQIGDETTTSRSAPTAVVWPSTTVTTSIAPGGQTSCTVRYGNAYCWGNNTYGQIGDGTTTARTAPTLVSGGYTWASISSEFDDNTTDDVATTCGVTTSGVGYCWGTNKTGQVGDGTTTQRTSPTLVSGGYTWASITVGWMSVCGITTSGAGYCWGNNTFGEVGDGTTTQRTTPTLISGGYTWASITSGDVFSCGVTTSGTGYCWGWNSFDELGNGNTTQQDSPAAVSGSYTWSSIYAGGEGSCGVTTAGAGYCWGYNSDGEVGNNSTTATSSPVSVSGSYTWSKIVTGWKHTCGFTTAGVGYCWGDNTSGEDGDGNTTTVHVPTAVSGSLTFVNIGDGMSHADYDTSCGLTVGGLEYCWGENNVDQVGDGTTTNRTSPTAAVWSDAAPSSPASLAQYKSDGVTSLSNGGYTEQSTVVLAASLSDSDKGDIDSICIEAIPTANTFQSVATTCGSPVPAGDTAYATLVLTGLPQGAYKWQAQAVDNAGSTSSWVSFNSGSTAFTFDNTAPTTGPVYDGSTAGVETSINNGSLSQLSCNWSGFSDSGSGLASYDYSFGSSPGDTSILGWTNVSTSTTNVTASSLTLHTSQSYYCNVRAHDNAGNVSSAVSSSGQMVAPTLTFSVSTNSVTFAALGAGSRQSYLAW